MIKWAVYAVLAYAALYAAVWLHEAGHAVCQYRFGCKAHWFQVQVKPYIFFSTPGAVDIDKYQALAPWQRALSAYGGVMANLFWGAAGGALLAAARPGEGYPAFFLWMFTTLHLAEIVSYLLIGNIFLVSDMAIIAQEYPRLRIPNLIQGVFLTAVYLWALAAVPPAFRGFVILWNGITILSMCGGRIVFSLLHRRNKP